MKRFLAWKGDIRTTNMRVPVELWEWIEKYTEEVGISKNAVLIGALEELRRKVERYRRRGRLYIPKVELRF